MRYELRELATPDDWATMHRIRREVLFTEARHPGVVYDEAHPHDLAAENRKFVLVLDGEAIGTVRLDPRGDELIVRLVGIDRARQRQGHGSALEELVVRYAKVRGAKRLCLNSAPEAVGFYEKLGWQSEVWDEAELVGLASSCLQMTKAL